jgi:hemerythrin
LLFFDRHQGQRAGALSNLAATRADGWPMIERGIRDDSFLAWTDSFAVGHKALDREHHHLVDIINEIHHFASTGEGDALVSLLKAIELAAIEHFRHENTVLRLEIPWRAGERAIVEHLAEHALALADLKAIVSGFSADGEISPARLSTSLRDWFVEHSLRYDADLKLALGDRNENT